MELNCARLYLQKIGIFKNHIMSKARMANVKVCVFFTFNNAKDGFGKYMEIIWKKYGRNFAEAIDKKWYCGII